MKTKFVIIADDFTGSNDTGVQFSKKGLSTVVVTNINEIDNAIGNSDVLVVDTESRFDNEKLAYEKVYEIGKRAKENHINFVYKKLDSTLKGNIGAEIAGVMDALSFPLGIVAAALPSNGRITKNGDVYVNGILLEETEAAKDPKTPVKHSSIEKIIALQSDKKTGNINIEHIKKGSKSLTQQIQKLKSQGTEIIIMDSEKAEDLKIIAEAISMLDDKVLMVGSSGLAEQIPQSLGLTDITNKSVAIIAGSVSEVTRSQIDYAKDNGNIDVININASRIFTREKEEERKRLHDLIMEYTNNGQSFILRSAQTREVVDRAIEAGKNNGLTPSQSSEEIAIFISQITKYIIENTQVKGLMMTGGDTAIKVAKSLNISGTIIKDEVLPGIPYGFFLDEKFKHIPIVTKAGGFGQEDAIINIINFLNDY